LAIKKVIKYPDPVLRRVCQKVQELNGKVNTVLRDMLDTMNRYSHCVGLAAIQIGEPYRIICVDVSKNPKYKGKSHGLIVLINPEIVEAEGDKISREGCMSVPDFVGYVHRHKRVLVKGITPRGKEIEIEAEGLEAIALQHEIDHLDGILFIDRITSPFMLMKRR